MREPGRQDDSVLRLGFLLLPILPIQAVRLWSGGHHFQLTAGQYVVLWLVGLGAYLFHVLAHEMAHVMAARLAGIGIERIVIGHWRRIWSGHLGRTLVILRALPDSGYVRARPDAALLSTPRYALFASAGLLTNAALAWAATIGLRSLPGDVTGFADFMLHGALWSLIALGGYIFATNAWPSTGQVGEQELATDGMVLWRLWTDRGRRREARQLARHLAAGEHAAALAILDRLRAAEPHHTAHVEVTALVLAESGDTGAAQALLEHHLDSRSLSKDERARVLDHLACLALYHGRTDLLARAEEWIRAALQCSPESATLTGTLGAVLVELGRNEEGRVLLEKCLHSSDSPADQAISLAYLAKLAHRMGESGKARELFGQALARNATAPIIGRIGAELGISPQ